MVQNLSCFFVTATNANISGTIKASGGNLDAWVIGNGGMYYSNGNSGCGLIGDSRHANIAIYAGANGQNIGGAPFRVFHDGSLYASNANITGTISAGSTINIGKNNGSIKFGSIGGIEYKAADGNYVDRVRVYNGSSEINLLNQNGGAFSGTGFTFEISGGIDTSILGDGVHTKAVYQTSDERKKTSIKKIDLSNEKFNSFFDLLSPVTFKFNNDEECKLHIGFVAQKIKQSLIDSNLYNDCIAILNESDEENLCLNYIEILPLCVNEIQKLKKQIKVLKEKITER